MKTLLLLLVIVNTSTSIAQLKSVGSHVYNWNEMVVDKTKSEERRLILKGSTSNFDYFEIYASTLYSKKSVGKFTNDTQEELIIVKDGNLKVTVKGESKILGPGGVALIMTGDEHSFQNDDKENAIYYILKYKSKSPTAIERGNDAGGSAFVNWSDIPFKTHEKGGRRQFFERPTSALSNLEMHVTTLNQGLASHPPHTHPEEEVLIMLRGQAQMHIDGAEFKVAPGGLIFLDSQVSHNIKSVGNEPSEYFAFSMRAFTKPGN